MNLEALRSRVCLDTPGTGIFFLSNVCFYMPPQVSSLGKSLFTLGATIRFLLGVSSTVVVQVARLGERHVTRGAGKGLNTCMYFL